MKNPVAEKAVSTKQNIWKAAMFSLSQTMYDRNTDAEPTALKREL